jgi:hypothetical protein
MKKNKYFDNEDVVKPDDGSGGEDVAEAATGPAIYFPKTKATVKGREFPLQDLIHVISGKMLSSSGTLDAIYDLLYFMTDYRVGPLEYGDALEACREGILEQYPKLDNDVIKKAEFVADQMDRWLKTRYREFGDDHAKLEKLHPAVRDAFRESMEEAAFQRRPPKKKAPTNKNLVRMDDEWN